jgi:hypothetical protein
MKNLGDTFIQGDEVNMDKFYVLLPPLESASDIAYATISGEQAYEINICERCERASFGRQLRNLSIEIFGERIVGFVWPDDASLIISKELMACLNSEGLKGIDFRPVRVVAWWRSDTNSEMVNWIKNSPSPELFQIVVKGEGGSLSSTSQIEIRSSCDKCGVREFAAERGLHVNTLEWDGSDIFTVKEFPNYVLVTERFLNTLSRCGAQNYSVKLSVELTIPRP